jgi:hypothetical protein
MLSERAPTPPRFIGQSTWMSRIGSKPKRSGCALHQLDDAATACSGSAAGTK